MFKITQGKGVSITFENGYTISIQWGFGSYCSNWNGIEETSLHNYQKILGEKGSVTAEIAVMDAHGDFCGNELGIFRTADVEGYCSPERALEIMNLVAQLPKIF